MHLVTRSHCFSRPPYSLWLATFFFLFFLTAGTHLAAQTNGPTNPIVYVTQPPLPNDFATANATFGNHRANLASIPRGGDLWIRYPNGTQRNLTAAAGYGNEGFQGANSIAVRDPHVHWDAEKILFSMVIGAPETRYKQEQYRFQIYELSNFAQNQTPTITKVPGQPSDYNNVMPIYGSDEQIIFISDRPVGGAAHLYPQLDEYESTPTNTGIWKLNPSNGELVQLDHAPSGSFDPYVDSFGRLLFTRWDHLQRDQQNFSGSILKAFNYEDESANAKKLQSADEVYPEPILSSDPDANNKFSLHRFNHFFPWMMTQNGEAQETLNHIGRHELHDFIGGSRQDDDKVVSFFGQYARTNPNPILNFFQLSESPLKAGRFIAVDAPEFGSHASGQIVAMQAAPKELAGNIVVEYLTHPSTGTLTASPDSFHSGLYRDPVLTSDNLLLAAHTAETRADSNTGSAFAPASRYDYQIKVLEKNGQYYQASSTLTTEVRKTLWYWNPDNRVDYVNARLWELQPQEVVARSRPPLAGPTMPAIESAVFDSLDIDIADFQNYLRQQNLALIISRDITSRDRLDKQQPFNLRVKDGTAESISESGKVYEVSHMQFFEGLLKRGYTYQGNDYAGRRVLAAEPEQLSTSSGALSSSGRVRVASDGSIAALVPSRRAMTWQLTNASGKAVVRERYWLTLQPGEIRVCASCHGVSDFDQLGRSEPTNTPLALVQLLEQWKTETPDETSSVIEADAKLRREKPRKRGRSSKRRRNIFRLELSPETQDAAGKEVSLSFSSSAKACTPDFSTNLPSFGQSTELRFRASSGVRKLKVEVIHAGQSLSNASIKLRNRRSGRKNCKLRRLGS